MFDRKKGLYVFSYFLFVLFVIFSLKVPITDCVISINFVTLFRTFGTIPEWLGQFFCNINDEKF